ncbi:MULTISPECIES: ATP-binding protein [unclassified Streptomyces]|uniref:ATP-binding protein n=1 Tax=unclassified Streptomyces TaxID=2593676 RepID=UPI001BEB7CF1|nr:MULTISPECIES: ATP-binding protein [unclassified Streptomyces]MBT2408039.1 ATP-binding protein [Streptomyces sp. ISL-21]MBT2611389.1 ATP-binding protein [Streptomyces sp. ISL-87]
MNVDVDANSREIVRRWTRHPRSVGRARHDLGKVLAGWGLSEIEDDALVVLSELLTNAVQHARVPKGREIETRYLRHGDGVRLEVHDAASLRPEVGALGPAPSGGRGLMLVTALADRWAVGDQSGPGKVVWAVLTPGGCGEHDDA